MSELICGFCSAQFDSARISCPRCGAPADIQGVADADGWIEAPGVKDMAEIEINGSTLQVSGIHVPMVDVKLAAGEGVYAHGEKVLWVDGVTLENHQVGGGWVLKATGPGRIAFSDNAPGEIIAIPLQAGGQAFVNGNHLLLASANLDYQHEGTNLWYQTVRTGDDGPDYDIEFPAMPFQQEFASSDGKPGLMMVHAKGNVFVRDLAEGQGIDIAVHCLVAWTGGYHKLKFQELRSGHRLLGNYKNKLISTHVVGPGRIWIMSGSASEDHFEDEQISDFNGGILIRH